MSLTCRSSMTAPAMPSSWQWLVCSMSRRASAQQAYLHVLFLPCLDLPSHIMLLSSRGLCKEIVKGPLLLAEVENLPQRAVADVWQGHYEQLRDLAL